MTDRLDVSAADAAAHGFDDGDPVRVASRHGATVLPLHVDDTAKPGEVFTTFADPTVFGNRVTGPWRDARTDRPEYKLTAVHESPGYASPALCSVRRTAATIDAAAAIVVAPDARTMKTANNCTREIIRSGLRNGRAEG